MTGTNGLPRMRRKDSSEGWGQMKELVKIWSIGAHASLSVEVNGAWAILSVAGIDYWLTQKNAIDLRDALTDWVGDAG